MIAEHRDVVGSLVPEATVVPMMNLQIMGGFADLAKWPPGQDVRPEAQPVLRLEVDVLVPLLPGHGSILARVHRFSVREACVHL
jgi:hypothetical protein